MTLRNRLGGDARISLRRSTTLLDNEDALIVLFDGRRMVSYTHGFAASPSQLELLDGEIERSIRNAVGSDNQTSRRPTCRSLSSRRLDSSQTVASDPSIV